MNLQSPIKKSSVVKALYTKGSSLYVLLKDTWYEFFDKAEHGQKMLEAESAGQYFNSEVWSDIPTDYKIAGSPAL